MNDDTKTAILGMLDASRTNAKKQLAAAEQAKRLFESLPECNVFENEDDAGEISERLEEYAREACQGAYNCGHDTYKQSCTIAGKPYMATLKVEYNRHDKTYYYIEETDFELKPVTT